MGGSISQTINNVNNTLTNNISNTLQKSATNLKIDQNINAECSSSVIKDIIKNYVKCVTDPTAKSSQLPVDSVYKLCNNLWSNFCNMNKINLTSNINVSNISQQQATTKQEVENTIKNTLSQMAGSSSSQSVSQNSNVISNLSNNIVQVLAQQSNTKTQINLFNVTASYISVSQSQDLILKVIEQDEQIQSVINNISTTITQSDMNSNSLYKNILILIIILVILYVLMSIIMTLKHSDSVSDFFYKILPTFIWFLLCVITTILHILVPPKYVTYTDKDNNKKISIPYLILYLSLYYIGSAIIVFTSFGVYRKYRK